MTSTPSTTATSAIPRHRAGAAMAATAVALALVLSGCGTTSDEPASRAAFNRTDVQFTRAMIPRQQQAATMSALAKTHSSSPAVVALAAQIHGAQGPWTRDMNGCLERWKSNDPSAMMSSPGAGGMMGSSGTGGMMGSGESGSMMSRADLEGLASRHGERFDRMFLSMMVRHHRATLDLARTEAAHGTSPAAKKLAGKVQMMQGPELRTMRRLMQP